MWFSGSKFQENILHLQAGSKVRKRLKILVVTATKNEIIPLVSPVKCAEGEPWEVKLKSYPRLNIQFLVTGIGMVPTAYHLGKALTHGKFDLILNVGVAGSYNKELPLGAVACITDERFGDLGASTGKGFQTLFELGLMDRSELPFTNGWLHNPLSNFYSGIIDLSCRGATVNRISGTSEEADTIRRQTGADIETMEGAAFFYVCLMEKVPFAAVRAVSNPAGERDHTHWDLSLAIQNLAKKVQALFYKLNQYDD